MWRTRNGSPCGTVGTSPTARTDPDCGPFLSFPGAGEVDFLVEGIDVLPLTGTPFVYIAVSGRNPVGISLWRFNTSSRQLTAIYQDTSRVSRQVRLVRLGNVVYAFSSYGNGLAVYNMSRAVAIGPCVQEESTDCVGVYQGNLGPINTGRYLDVLVRPTGELLVAATNGNIGNQGLELWRVSDPSNPEAANKLFDGLDNRTFGTALFTYEGNDYLAAVVREGTANKIKIYNINACSGSGTCSLGAPVFDDVSVPPFLSDQFLTFSTSNGTPFLYYGLFAGLAGEQVEQLFDLTTLGRANQNIREMTDGGPTYFDTCAEENLDYWAWYYAGNEFGPNNFTPRVGKFNPETNIFYRAAGGILDVHVWEGGDSLDPTITTLVSNPDPQGLYWMGDDITFEGEGSDGCDPAGIWTWIASTPPEINAVNISEIGNSVTFRFDCNAGGGRCDDADVSVSGTNSDPSCDEAELVVAAVTVKDPSFDITSIEPASGMFTQCSDVDFTAGLVGRGPIDLDWAVRRDPAQDSVQDPQQTLDQTVNNEDLSTASPMFTWNTATASFAGIFADGFESGDVSAWGQPPLLIENFIVEVALNGLSRGGPSASATVELASISGDPTFGIPAIESNTADNSTFDFHANTLSGTVSEWSWELEDDDGGSLCTFGSDTNVPCTLKTGQDISHTWIQQSGARRVDLAISNCQSTTTTVASTTVTVESFDELEITSFGLDRDLSNGACEINFDCINQLICVCHRNQNVFFEVVSTGDPDFYDFDWDGNGTFEDTGNPATGTGYSHIYPSVIGVTMPAVRARRGAATPAERDLLETLDIQP